MRMAWLRILLEHGRFSRDVQRRIAEVAPETPGWVPAECDVPIRKDRWFWHPDEEHLLLSVDQLMEIYYRSVGHGATLRQRRSRPARRPEADVKRLLAFGERSSVGLVMPWPKARDRERSLN